MILNVFVDDQCIELEVPESMLAEAENFFAKMDADLEGGLQLGRIWVEDPGTEERCKVVGDKLLAALENENQPMIGMMAGYILKRLPGVSGVRLATNGEVHETEFIMKPNSVS
jgi:hypothetical protein